MAEIDKIQNLRYMHMDNVKRVSINRDLFGIRHVSLHALFRLATTICQYVPTWKR